MTRYPLQALIVAMVAATSGAAIADDAGTRSESSMCAQSFGDAQRLRRDGHLRRARTELVRCGQPVCGDRVAADCARWLREVDDSMPTVVLGARDSRGMDVLEARVLFDGEVLVDKLDGRAVAVDPGAHVLRFEGPGGQNLNQPVVIRQGEKDRRIVVDLANSSTPAEVQVGSQLTSNPMPPSTETAEPVAPQSTSAIPVGTWVAGSIGVLALASFTYFGLRARSDINDMRGTCAPHCPSGDVDSAKTKAIVADVSLGVGVASIALATWFFLDHRRDKPSRSMRLETTGSWVGVVGSF